MCPVQIFQMLAAPCKKYLDKLEVLKEILRSRENVYSAIVCKKIRIRSYSEHQVESKPSLTMHLCLNGDACSPACAAAHSAVLRISLPLDFIICWLCWRWKDYDLTHHHQHLWYSAANTVQVAIVLLLHICPLVLAVANTHRVDVRTYNKKKDAETLGPEEGEVKKWHSEENYIVKYVSFVAYRASAEKTVRPSFDCWYQQTGPAQFGQNHPRSSFFPH